MCSIVCSPMDWTKDEKCSRLAKRPSVHEHTGFVRRGLRLSSGNFFLSVRVHTGEGIEQIGAALRLIWRPFFDPFAGSHIQTDKRLWPEP